MKLIYWIKFSNYNSPERHVFENMEEMLWRIKEIMMRKNTGWIEWMVKE